MKILSIDEAVKKIQLYLKRNSRCPYFVIADEITKCNELKQNFADLSTVYISDFCVENFLLDTDLLIEKLNSLEKNVLCFGLGEYIYFTGQESILRMLQDKIFNRKIIFICRKITNLLEHLAGEDLKFRANNICQIDNGDKENFSVVKYNPEMDVETDAKNFSELLKMIECEKNNFITVKSDLPLKNVKEINTFFDAVKNKYPYLEIQSAALNEKQWREYFFDDKCVGYSPEHWRSFAAGFKNQISDAYLNFVFHHSVNYEEYQKNLIFALIDVKDEKVFTSFYSSRMMSIKKMLSHYISEYIKQLKKNFSSTEEIKYLTDNTAEERCEMIVAMQGKDNIPSILKKNYTAMNDYLSDYDFNDEELTKYFRHYKKIKLCNINDEDFNNYVKKIALERPYNKFETRRAILDKSDKNAKLYWLDALGVEFLGYIKLRATHAELFVKINVARAELPTLTSQNKDFYDDWQGDKFDKNQKLDELKHSPEKFDENGKCSAPVYMDEEFKIIDAVIDEIKNSLINHEAEKIILTSDHGASRLAVMFGREKKYKMNSVGKHSGRCCPINEIDEKPDCSTEENGWWVLADYDRFSGGRLASVEIHGGATLEEILVPIIEFSLAKKP